jgi:hypothetical protein
MRDNRAMGKYLVHHFNPATRRAFVCETGLGWLHRISALELIAMLASRHCCCPAEPASGNGATSGGGAADAAGSHLRGAHHCSCAGVVCQDLAGREPGIEHRPGLGTIDACHWPSDRCCDHAFQGLTAGRTAASSEGLVQLQYLTQKRGSAQCVSCHDVIPVQLVLGNWFWENQAIHGLRCSIQH